ncbi:fimbrial protein [Orbus sturtevantii]|uniref:fimbrial protein n=1 Tax=Orbus sturtevantii TaxID=3074109 RepID=UPI00370D1B35
MIKKYQLSFIAFLALVSFTSYATDVEIQITGKVVTQTCNVINDDKEKHVAFADFNQTMFKTIGDVSESKPVKIKLENCNPSIDKISYQFSGEPEPSDTSLLKVLGNSQGAIVSSGLAIQILDSSQSPIKLNQSYTLNNIIFKDVGKYDFDFFLRYKSIGVVTIGDASSVLYLDFNYE